ncbi:hypothetical protein [Methylacidiphilum kamchatkense]|uniref:Uncharacterized protein n=1 Tax=Methylacidiphilum kamchatkense Kam1 TaxID=1202785 RepID=A0A516TNT0_9BACT|nr:hypothetical protein [Methylacidiphilum kamchatkense]QDQ42907.1 hypothetical protein kam1_1692 [Methylacidiphilum kamchatkense Kam1]
MLNKVISYFFFSYLFDFLRKGIGMEAELVGEMPVRNRKSLDPVQRY